MYEKVIIDKTDRLRRGYQWVFSNEIASDFKHFIPGSLVELWDKKNKFLGIGYINPHSLITIRILSRKKEEINNDFFHKRIIEALNYRKKLNLNRDFVRLVYSEGDFIPGLIVDKFAECLVVQINTAGLEIIKDTILNILENTLNPKIIVLRNDSPSRVIEGLQSEIKVIKGSLESPPVIKEDDVLFEVNPLESQKTGFFIDQSENRQAFSKYIREGIGLDVFCNTGAWGLHLAKKGCIVIGIDESPKALQQAQRNIEINKVKSNYRIIQQDAFNFLKQKALEGEQYDFIILDPPAFVKSKQKIKEAIKGYIDLNKKAFMLLKKDGFLATSSCSYHIARETFREIITIASNSAGKTPKLFEFRSQSLDHPILLNMPETEYLKCVFLKV
ncbi:MAG: class I SAM-dependent rRNA methyltransferase [Thermodesulfovibrionales bacterium]|nr:class I SAM-dependent rRNA methyltransferase [Thermodesulfovibrionales bacterium]